MDEKAREAIKIKVKEAVRIDMIKHANSCMSAEDVLRAVRENLNVPGDDNIIEFAKNLKTADKYIDIDDLAFAVKKRTDEGYLEVLVYPSKKDEKDIVLAMWAKKTVEKKLNLG